MLETTKGPWLAVLKIVVCRKTSKRPDLWGRRVAVTDAVKHIRDPLSLTNGLFQSAMGLVRPDVCYNVNTGVRELRGFLLETTRDLKKCDLPGILEKTFGGCVLPFEKV